MFRNYKSVWTREVLIEKVKDHSGELYIYTNKKQKLKFADRQQLKQRKIGEALAKDWGFKKTILCHEFNNDTSNNPVFGSGFLELLRLVQQGVAKNIYFESNILVSDNKYARALILFYLETSGVNIYTKCGRYTTSNDRFDEVNGMINYLRDYKTFVGLLESDFSILKKNWHLC